MTTNYDRGLTPDQLREEAEYDRRQMEWAKEHSIKPGSKEMEALLAVGYPDIGTRKHAEEIIKTRKENPLYYPYELQMRAEAFLAALDTKPIVIDPVPGNINRE